MKILYSVYVYYKASPEQLEDLLNASRALIQQVEQAGHFDVHLMLRSEQDKPYSTVMEVFHQLEDETQISADEGSKRLELAVHQAASKLFVKWPELSRHYERFVSVDRG